MDPQEIFQLMIRHFSVHGSNEQMVVHLTKFDELNEERLVEAFRKVDKRFFVPKQNENDAYGMRPFVIREEDYDDEEKEEILNVTKEQQESEPGLVSPVPQRRRSRVDDDNDVGAASFKELTRISAPNMYAKFLKHLDLKEGQIVLDIGCGSGYSTALISYVIGKTGVIHAVDVTTKVVSFTKRSITKLNNYYQQKEGKPLLESEILYQVHNCFVPFTHHIFRQYDRILVGADCSSIQRVKILATMLKVGGAMIVPCVDKILKVTRLLTPEPPRPERKRRQNQHADEPEESEQQQDEEEQEDSVSYSEGEFKFEVVVDGVAFAPLRDPEPIDINSALARLYMFYPFKKKQSRLFKCDTCIRCWY